MKKSIFFGLFLLGLAVFILNSGGITFKEKSVQLPEITKPRTVVVYENELFVVDNKYTIKIYSLPDFKLKRQMGKRGEGPGEFRHTFKISVKADFIFMDSQDRVSWFSRQGKFLKYKNKSFGKTFIPLKDNFVVRTFRPLPNQKYESEIGIYNSELVKTKTIEKYQRKRPYPLIGPGQVIKEWPLIIPYHHISLDESSGRIFIFDSERGFFIKVYDDTGTHLYNINKDIAKIKVPDLYKEKRTTEFKEDSFWLELQKPKLTFPEYFPDFRWAQVSKGNIYIQTYKNKGAKTLFIVLDLKGKMLRETYLPVLDSHLQAVFGSKLYKLTENMEEETWELYIYQI
jgi:hypothetical protein